MAILMQRWFTIRECGNSFAATVERRPLHFGTSLLELPATFGRKQNLAHVDPIFSVPTTNTQYREELQ